MYIHLTNSPQAAARIVALTHVANGQVRNSELDVLVLLVARSTSAN